MHNSKCICRKQYFSQFSCNWKNKPLTNYSLKNNSEKQKYWYDLLIIQTKFWLVIKNLNDSTHSVNYTLILLVRSDWHRSACPWCCVLGISRVNHHLGRGLLEDTGCLFSTRARTKRRGETHPLTFHCTWISYSLFSPLWK